MGQVNGFAAKILLYYIYAGLVQWVKIFLRQNYFEMD